jgi:hypothetical protein
VLAGPKRETWFSAETIVALCRAGRPTVENPWVPDFTCWGEQQFSTVFQSVKAKVGHGDEKRKPDIVCYRPIDGEGAVAAVLEIKLVRNDENSKPCLAELKSQLLNARTLFPNADLLGVIFFAAAPVLTPRSFEKAIESVHADVSSSLPEDRGFKWVSDPGFVSIFEQVSTGFYYPAMSVSLSLAVLQYAPAVNSAGR